MIMLPSGLKVFVLNEPVNMHKSFDGLAALAQTEFKKNALNGDLFVFFNRPCDKVKVLQFDRTGFSIWYKRLEKGRFRLPKMQQKVYTLSISDFNLLLEGIDLVYRRHVSAI